MKKLFVLFAVLSVMQTKGQDRIFTYTYQSNVLNKSQKEIEITTTFATNRQYFYRGLSHNLEFEMGLGGKLQTAFYLNYGYSQSITENGGIQILNKDNSFSFSNEWKLKLSDPVANKLGSALYFEYTLAPSETEFEGKLILDKQTGRIIQSFNLTGELGYEKEFHPEGNVIGFENEQEFKLELNYGLSYKMNDRWFVGFEAMNENVLAESNLEKSILSAGPGISYSGNGFWINLTVMPQITDLKSGKRNVTEDDGLQSRLIFSYEF